MINDLTNKLKILNNKSGYEFFITIGVDYYGLSRYNRKGKEDRISDFESMEHLENKIDELVETDDYSIYWLD